ncbi:hypothetical protein OJ997_35005, partial [Solirubrobacter phytolaccae]
GGGAPPGRGDDLPALAASGDALVAAARRDELPSIEAFGERLVARARRPPRRRRLRSVAIALAVVLPVGATSGAATAVVLRQTVISAPVPEQVPDEQTPLAGTAVVSKLRAADPGGGPPWTLRVARSKTGFTCTTVGQVQDGVFGLVGLDGTFRRLPGELSDACGQGGTLTGARVMAADLRKDVRSVVYGVAGDDLRAAVMLTATGQRRLKLGPGGTYVAVLRGYPEDHLLDLRLEFADGHSERHKLGNSRSTVPDPEGAQAWAVDRYVLGTRLRCAFVREARASGQERVKSPTACLGLRKSKRLWVADARTLRPGDQGVPGFDRWTWLNAPERTVVWGVARSHDAVRKVVLLGAGAPKALTISKQGAFAAVLPATTKPETLSLDVTLADGTVQHGKPGEGLVPDLVKSRRPR